MRSKIDDTTAESLPAALFLEGSTQGIIRATFNDGGGDYAYFTGGLDIQVGDAVVVASPYGDGPSGGTFDEACGGYLKVLRVVSLQPDVTAIERAAKWVISKVDTTAYVVRRARVEELRTIDAQIKRARIAAIEAMQLAELSKYSPELADLVAKRTALAGAPSEAEPVTPAA